MDGKAISVRRPWGPLIIDGQSLCGSFKDIENRDWYTTYRGELYIHVSATLDREGIAWMKENDLSPDSLPKSCIIGVVDLVDVVTQSDSLWFCGKYGFVLRNPRPITPIEMPGKLGIFNFSV